MKRRENFQTYRTHYNKLKKIRMMVSGSPGPSVCALVLAYRQRDLGKEVLTGSVS
jgi:hypothetical protein